MNPNYGYQLYQAQRVKTRAEAIAGDAGHGHQAAAVSPSGRRLARTAGGWGIMALNAIAGRAARATARTA